LLRAMSTALVRGLVPFGQAELGSGAEPAAVWREISALSGRDVECTNPLDLGGLRVLADLRAANLCDPAPQCGKLERSRLPSAVTLSANSSTLPPGSCRNRRTLKP
jgi:hypothetical protein